MSELHIPRVAILASGSGTTAEAFIRATQDGRVSAEVGLVVSNKPDAGIFGRIDRLNTQYGIDIETSCINRFNFPATSARGQSPGESEAIAQVCRSHGIDHVALMGYMLIVGGALLEEYDGQISNTHPGLLPETANTIGVNASQRILDLGLLETAHTVHLVDEGVDTGPILCSTPVPVEPEDTAESLFARVQVVEKAVLPLVLDSFLNGSQVSDGNS